MSTHLNWLRVAIHIRGSRKELAKRARIKKGRITEWLNETRKINLENAFKIEMATEGKVRGLDLVTYLDPQLKAYLSAQISKDKDMPSGRLLKERVEIGLAYEKAFQSQFNREKGHSLCENFHKTIHENSTLASECHDSKILTRLDARAANYAGFGNYRTYRDAKALIQRNIPALIAAVDNKQLSIHRAAQLARQPEERLQYFLQWLGDKKALINALNSEKLLKKLKRPEKKYLKKNSELPLEEASIEAIP